MAFAWLFLLFIVAAVVIRLVAGSFDGDRVEAYVQSRGWELLDKSWDPFGPGWFGEKDSRIYQIVFRDQSGAVRRAHVKTSMLSGVYLTNEQVVEAPPAPASTLEEENRRLKEKIKELESRTG